MTGGARRSERHQNDEALFIRDYFRGWLAGFKLSAHFLKARSKRFNLLLQARGRRLQLRP